MIEASGVLAPVDAVAAFIARHQVARRLRHQHLMRLAVALGATALVVLYNLLHPHASTDLGLRIATARTLCAIHLALCFLVLSTCWWRLSRRLHEAPGTLADQVWRLASFTHRWGNVLLFLGATGHGVLMLGTLLGLNLAAPDGRILILALIPTILVLVHGICEIPTPRRLLALHRQVRARAGRGLA